MHFQKQQREALLSSVAPVTGRAGLPAGMIPIKERAGLRIKVWAEVVGCEDRGGV